MSVDRRQYARIPFHGVASLQLRSALTGLRVKVMDLSLNGALLEVPEHVELFLGQTGTLNLQLGPAGNNICMVVELAYVRGQRVGCQCRNIDLESVTHLRRLVSMNLGDAALLQRELTALIAS